MSKDTPSDLVNIIRLDKHHVAHITLIYEYLEASTKKNYICFKLLFFVDDSLHQKGNIAKIQ